MFHFTRHLSFTDTFSKLKQMDGSETTLLDLLDVHSSGEFADFFANVALKPLLGFWLDIIKQSVFCFPTHFIALSLSLCVYLSLCLLYLYFICSFSLPFLVNVCSMFTSMCLSLYLFVCLCEIHLPSKHANSFSKRK